MSAYKGISRRPIAHLVGQKPIKHRDPTAKSSFISISKGVSCYVYIDPSILSYNSGLNVNFISPSTNYSVINGGFSPPSSSGGDIEISTDDISSFNPYVTLEWSVFWEANNTGECCIDSLQINPITGNIASGSIPDMMSTTPLSLRAGLVSGAPALEITNGFYDAGPGYTGLTNQDQLYVYVTNSHKNWMQSLAQQACAETLNQQLAGDLPLNYWCLPGAHDAGMCTMANVYNMVASTEAIAFETVLLGLMYSLYPPLMVSGVFGLADLPNIIMNTAITQNNSITTMLNSGIRYFDFRPGYMYSPLSYVGSGLYHQHNFIPGYDYISFLEDIINWLSQDGNSEIVVINLNDDGFAATDDMSPTDADLNAAWTAALGNCNLDAVINCGGPEALSSTYNELVTSNTRIIFLNQLTNATQNAAAKNDSYSDAAYATLDPTTITDAFSSMSFDSSSDYVLLQCQGTATAVPGVVPWGVITISSTASPLMATKPAFDANNLGWISVHANSAFTTNQLLVVLNDFADNATASTCIGVCMQRMGISATASTSSGGGQI